MTRHRFIALLGVVLITLLASTPLLAEIRVVRDQEGEYRATRLLTAGRGGIWAMVSRQLTPDVLNPAGDLLGDRLPVILESPVAPHAPWVVWSRVSERELNLAWSTWSDAGWQTIQWIEAPGSKVGDSLDANLVFDELGRPYVVWWRNDRGFGQIYLSIFLETKWMPPFQVSWEDTDSRYPTLEIAEGGELIVRYDTPDGQYHHAVWFNEPVTITDDIHPLDVMSPGQFILVEELLQKE